MPKEVVGLVGEKGGGKGTVFVTLKELLPDKRVERVSSSDLLASTLDLWALKRTRENFIKLVAAMNDGFGEGTLTNALKQQTLKSGADIVIIDSIRLQSDLDMLRSIPGNLLLYVTADAKIRYDRTKARGEKEGETKASFEQFQKEESAHTEQLVPKIGAQADFTINNNGTLEEFKAQVKEFAAKFL